MEFSISEIVLTIGLVISGIYISYQQGKIDKFRKWSTNTVAYNSYLFHAHQRIGELSLSLVKSCEELTIENKRLNNLLKNVEIKNVNQKQESSGKVYN